MHLIYFTYSLCLFLKPCFSLPFVSGFPWTTFKHWRGEVLELGFRSFSNISPVYIPLSSCFFKKWINTPFIFVFRRSSNPFQCHHNPCKTWSPLCVKVSFFGGLKNPTNSNKNTTILSKKCLCSRCRPCRLNILCPSTHRNVFCPCKISPSQNRKHGVHRNHTKDLKPEMNNLHVFSATTMLLVKYIQRIRKKTSSQLGYKVGVSCSLQVLLQSYLPRLIDGFPAEWA